MKNKFNKIFIALAFVFVFGLSNNKSIASETQIVDPYAENKEKDNKVEEVVDKNDEKDEENEDKYRRKGLLESIDIKKDNIYIHDKLTFLITDKKGKTVEVNAEYGKLNNVEVEEDGQYTIQLKENDKFQLKPIKFKVKVIEYYKFVAEVEENKLLEVIELKDKEKEPDVSNTVGWYFNNENKAWYYINKNGSYEKGWLYDKKYNSWFFLDRKTSKMVTGWFYDNNVGKWYYFRSNGKMEIGWFYDNNYSNYFYLRPSGEMEIGWFYYKKDGNWYYFNNDGQMNKSAKTFGNSYVLNGVFQTNSGYRRASVGSNYIVINLSRQRIWLIRNNDTIVNVGVITGKLGTLTPLGNYKIQGMQRDRILKGPGYASWVGYWLPFYGDYGIHDANWHPSYRCFEDPTYYKWYGSHGCVNIHPSDISSIYNNTYVGMPVIVTD